MTLRTEPVVLSQELPGRTVAALRAEVRPQVGGIVVEQAFTEGSDVKAGQILYRIDPAPFRAAYREAKAALSHAQASVSAARLRSERYRQLVDVEAVSKQEADDAAATFQQALTSVEQARAALSTAKIALDYSAVRAPIDGRVGISRVTVGALVTGNQPEPLSIIRNLQRIYVDVTQSSTELLRLRRLLAEQGADGERAHVATAVTLLLADGTTYPHPGVLKSREVAVDEETGAVTLRAEFPNPDEQLLPGMYVRARLAQVKLSAAILAPQQGIARSTDGSATALVVTEDELVERREVEVSRALDAYWLVERGLTAGERVVVEGSGRVKSGERVQAVEVTLKPRASAPDAPPTHSSSAAVR